MRDVDAGVILVNVLVALALGSALVVLMLTSQDNLLDRARRAAALSQAEALALGAETSVLTALRRDMTDAPDADYMTEPWALAAQQEVVLETGRFQVTIEDEQARLDLNAITPVALRPAQALERLVSVLQLPPETTGRVAAQIVRDGPLSRIDDLTDLDPATRAALAPHVAFLPAGGRVNFNTAGAPVIEAVIRSRTAALRLVALRDRTGQVTAADLATLGIVGGFGGYTSDVYAVTVLAEVDGMTAELHSRMQRVSGFGRNEVRVIDRRFGPPMPIGGLPEPQDPA